jgi:hypothetical protein
MFAPTKISIIHQKKSSSKALHHQGTDFGKEFVGVKSAPSNLIDLPTQQDVVVNIIAQKLTKHMISKI